MNNDYSYELTPIPILIVWDVHMQTNFINVYDIYYL